MIIETRDDVVRLSGSLSKNQWLSIKAAASLLLHEHPEGIIIDCAGLETITQDGAKTFLEAMRDIEAHKARIVVANLPADLKDICKCIPGVRSQLPIADSVESARASLRMALRAAAKPGKTAHKTPVGAGGTLLVPLLAGVDLTPGADLAAQLARECRGEVRLVYFLEVSRNLPLQTPMAEEEQAAGESLNSGAESARPYGVPVHEQVERVRDAVEGILTTAKGVEGCRIVLGAAYQSEGADSHDLFYKIVDTLLHRAPCEVVIGRRSPA